MSSGVNNEKKTSCNLDGYNTKDECSCMKPMGFALLIILGFGFLGLAGVGLGGCVGTISNLSQISSMIMMTAGSCLGVPFLVIGIIFSVKNYQKNNLQQKDNDPSLVVEIPQSTLDQDFILKEGTKSVHPEQQQSQSPKAGEGEPSQMDSVSTGNNALSNNVRKPLLEQIQIMRGTDKVVKDVSTILSFNLLLEIDEEELKDLGDQAIIDTVNNVIKEIQSQVGRGCLFTFKLIVNAQNSQHEQSRTWANLIVRVFTKCEGVFKIEGNYSGSNDGSSSFGLEDYSRDNINGLNSDCGVNIITDLARNMDQQWDATAAGDKFDRSRKNAKGNATTSVEQHQGATTQATYSQYVLFKDLVFDGESSV